MDPNVTRPKLPTYDSPPAVETLMGVHFARLAGWNVLHFGELHAQFRAAYPKSSLLPPLIDQRELAQGTLNPHDLLVRAIFTDSSDSQLVQVQSSMFLRNWKRAELTEEYRHYESLKPKFLEDWKKFRNFLDENGMKTPQVFHCEVTYVNNMIRGKDWDTYNDLAKILKPFAPRHAVSTSGRVYDYLPEASAVSLTAGYQLAETGISLQVSIQSALRRGDGSEVIQMSITAKTAPRSNVDSAISDALDSCHDSVILGFDDVITKDAQQKWGRHDPS